MMRFELDKEIFVNGVSRVVYDNVWNIINLDPRFDYNDFYVNYDMKVVDWIDDERADCIIDKVSVTATVNNARVTAVEVGVYAHDIDYGIFDPDFSEYVDCNVPLENTKLYSLFSEIVRKSAVIACHKVTENVTNNWTMEGF